MLNANQAVAKLEAYRRSLGIPAQAVLAFLEKRSIELADRDEIEPVLPVPVEGGVGVGVGVGGGEAGGEGPEADAEPEAAASEAALDPLNPSAAAASAAATAPADGDEPGNLPPLPVYTETFAWVGRYTYRIFYWELALDKDGTLIRLRKSR